MSHALQNPDFERLVRDSFDKQRAMRTLGALLARVEPGAVEIHLPYREDLTQQHGFLHAGVVTAIARARVLRSGRTISVCQADGIMRTGDEETPIATMLATMMTVTGRADVVG